MKKPYRSRDDKPFRQKPNDQGDRDNRDAPQDLRARAVENLADLEAKMPGLGARRGALDVLMLLSKGRTLEQAFNDCRSFNTLEGADRAFAFNLVSTTLRRRGALDEIIGQYLDRPLPKKSLEVQDILRLAVAQLLMLETPAHAAVATSVELTGQKRETAGYKGLVNAIARKIADKGKLRLEKLQLRVDTPGWLWRSWERSYGVAKTRAIAEAHLKQAPLDLSLKPGTDPASFQAVEGGLSLAPNHLRLPGNHSVPDLPGFSAGSWWVQDLAASLPVRLLGDVRAKIIFDLCAAPGGKTMQLAASGGDVKAVDVSGERLKRVAENLKRTGLIAETVKADILHWVPEITADAILLDAPCSSTGTIRRNPDVAWARTEDEVRSLAGLQAEFIDRAVRFLKPGGLLVYCTCSLQREEGEDQVKAAFSRHNNLELVPITAADIDNMPGIITHDGNLRTLPSMLPEHGGMDGFFACRFRKT